MTHLCRVIVSSHTDDGPSSVSDIMTMLDENPGKTAEEWQELGLFVYEYHAHELFETIVAEGVLFRNFWSKNNKDLTIVVQRKMGHGVIQYWGLVEGWTLSQQEAEENQEPCKHGDPSGWCQGCEIDAMAQAHRFPGKWFNKE